MSSKATVIDADGARGRLLTAMPAAARAGTVAIALEDGRHVVVPHERLAVENDGAAYRLDGRFADFEMIDPSEAAPTPESAAMSGSSDGRSSNDGRDSNGKRDANNKRDSDRSMSIAHEEISVERRKRPIGRVRLDKRVETEEVTLDEDIEVDEVDIERVPVGKVVDEAPQVRHEGDTLVIPVVEERLVKQLVLVEEVHVHRRRHKEQVDIPVTLRREQVDISRERLDSSGEHGEDRPSR